MTVTATSPGEQQTKGDNLESWMVSKTQKGQIYHHVYSKHSQRIVTSECCKRFWWRNDETEERSRKGSSVFGDYFCLFIGQFSIKKQSFGDQCLIVVMQLVVNQEEGTFPSANRSKQAGWRSADERVSSPGLMFSRLHSEFLTQVS